jgi:RNA polymerase sigma factor (sigma-70 family)
VRPEGGRRGRIGSAFPTVLAAARSERQWAFDRLYRAMAPAVAGYLRLQGSPEPDDLTNEVFFQVLTALESFDGDEEGFYSWVFTIAHRRLFDERRRAGRRPAVAEGGSGHLTEASGGDVEDEAMRNLSVERVRRLCQRLSPDQRDVLLLRLVATLTIEQAGEALGKSPTAVKALQRRGLGAVRRQLDREGVSV